MTSSPRICGSCGREVLPGKAFCGQCGTPYSQPPRSRALLYAVVSVCAVALVSAGVLFLVASSGTSSNDPDAGSAVETAGPSPTPSPSPTQTAESPSACPSGDSGAGASDDPNGISLGDAPSSSSPDPCAEGGPSDAPTVVAPTPIVMADLMVSASCEGDKGLEGDNTTEVFLSAANLVDGRADTAWRCTFRENPADVRSDWLPKKSRALGETVDFAFPSVQRVQRIKVRSGYVKKDPAKDYDRYAENGKVTALEWVFNDDPATTIVQTITPLKSFAAAEAHGWDSVDLPVPLDVSTVRMTIVDARNGSRKDIRGSAAMSEVVFE